MKHLVRFVLAVCLCGISSCDTSPRPTPGRPNVALDRIAPRISTIEQEPIVRVRVAVQQTHVRFNAARSITIGPGPADQGKSHVRQFHAPVTIRRISGAWLISDSNATAMRWPLPTLTLEAGAIPRAVPGAVPGAGAIPGAGISVDDALFPGKLVLRPSKHAPLRFDVMNHVALETYLPGVLQRELFPKWHPAAYRAQAIAARSYAIVQLTRHRDRAYDLESTTASQVYAGRATSPRAIDAVGQTRGLVLTYQGRVIEAFYSSTSGGMGQDATVAFPNRPGWFDIPPLQGQRHGWGTKATYYHWGPVAREASTLARRFAAWGQAEKNAIGNLVGLRSVRISGRSRTGRPAQFTVIDSRGRTYKLGPEQLRFAANHDAPGLQSVSSNQQLRSSNVAVRMAGRSVQFYNGQGYGHGVGLCQWSAQEMATRGYDENTILHTFYSQSAVRKAY